MKKLISAVLVLTMIVACFAGCGKSLPQATTPAAPAATEAAPAAPAETEAPKDLAFAEGTILRMATGYNSKKTGLFFDAEVAGEGIQLADGVTYQAGDLKPTWVEVQNRLGMVFEDKYQGNSAQKEFEYWKDRLGEVDMVSGNATTLNEYGTGGSLVNIAEYLDQMPNFKAYLDENPDRKSVV